MNARSTNQGLKSWRGRLSFESLYTAGLAGQKFLDALRSKGQLLGTHCRPCDLTYVPARLYCERCMAKLDDYVPVAGQGTVVTVTTVHVDLDGRRLLRGQRVAAVQLDGASTVLIHRLLGEAKIGDRVGVALEGRRKGSVLDIKGFQPV